MPSFLDTPFGLHRPASTRLCPVAYAAAALCWVYSLGAPSAFAQTPEEAPIPLKGSGQLQEQFANDLKQGQPTFLFGDRLSGRPELETTVEGHAELRRSGSVIKADRIEYYQPDDTAKARGNVRINRAGTVYEGSEMQIKVGSMEGFFIEPRFKLLKNGGHGEATRIDFVDEKNSVARNATYTTCERSPGPGWLPGWVLKADQVKFDFDTDSGEAQGVQLRFKDVPILALPALSFPLSDARKSGWLPPALNIDNTSGIEVMQPYYWNIAPNRDATLYPSLLSKRGVNLGGEFRYLENDYAGSARYDWMPADKLRPGARWGLATSHSGSIATGLPKLGVIGVNLAINRVSDANYWSDFPRSTTSLTQRLLATDGTLSWAQGYWGLTARALKWQTLQAPDTITPPYDRLPQINARYTRGNVSGFDVSTELDYTQFQSQTALTLQPNAQRAYAVTQISRPWVAPGAYVTPKLQLHTAAYAFDSALSNGSKSATRIVPTASLDSGLSFERAATFFGRSFTQTLEPRAFYVYTPFRNQSLLPNYDSGTTDFNFATIYTDNPFVGHDRIADNNLLTVGVSSRLLDPTTGAEALRLSYAQRLRFIDQLVTLPGGSSETAKFSDMLFGASINWRPEWTTDATIQVNPKTNRSERSTLSGRYSPSNYRVLSAAYRFTRNASEQVDLGWQWPLNDLWGDKGQNLPSGQGQGPGRWYSVGRLNYSLQDRKIVDSILGLEYDAGCWLSRMVFERLQTANLTSNKRILLQLEFVGFSRLGTNPLKTLRQNIPRYQFLRETTANPSRFSNYE